MRNEGMDIHVSYSLDVLLDKKLLEKVDLIVPVWTAGNITADQEKGLLLSLEFGVVIGGWYVGMGDAFRRNPSSQFMVGGQWLSHFGS
ncbi:MAG TPA: ThuA domain-containing protein, partial [bacterium]|nr:ThuA domain-containing protein [bacterium]